MAFIRNLLAVVVSIFGLVFLIPFMVMGIPLWLISSLTRAVTYFLKPRFSPWRDLIEFEPTIGWKPMSNLDTHYVAVGNDICHIITDSYGWLGRNRLSDSSIVVIGDSFAFGYGVNINDSYMETNPNLRVKAIGAPGYNMVQELMIMRKISPQLNGKLVVWFICLQNDLFDNLRPDKPNFYRTPFVRNINDGGDWEVVTSHVNKAKWPYPTLKRPYASMFSKLCIKNRLSDHVYSACEFLISEALSVCKNAGAQLAIMTIPSKNQLSDFDQIGRKNLAKHLVNVSEKDINTDYPDQCFGDICNKFRVMFYPAKNYLGQKDYKTYDCHWTKSGNKRVANILSDIYDNYISGKMSQTEENNYEKSMCKVSQTQREQ